MRLLRKLFSPKKRLYCGGEGRIDIVDALGTVVSSLYFVRPDSDMRLNYTYKYQELSTSTVYVKEIEEDKEKGGNVSTKLHEIIDRELFVPEAKRLFVRSVGYFDENKNPIDGWDKDRQLEMLLKYWRHHLSKMVAIAYEDTTDFKKKH